MPDDRHNHDRAEEPALERVIRRIQRQLDLFTAISQTIIRALTPVALGAGLIYYVAIGGEFSFLGFEFRASSLAQILLALVALIAVGIFFSMFLESGGGVLRKSIRSETVAVNTNGEHAIASSAERAESIESGTMIKSAEREQFIDELKTSLKREAGRDVIDELRASLKITTATALIAESENVTLTRLRDERLRLARRANMNLFLGIVITVIGLGLLLTYAQDQLATLRAVRPEQAGAAVAAQTNILQSSKALAESGVAMYMLTFVPRLALVALIELFAYFFLGLYKVSLAEVKYVQNEMTGVESRILALGVAIQLGERGSMSEILKAVASVDRNNSFPAPRSEVSSDKVLEVAKELIGTMKK